MSIQPVWLNSEYFEKILRNFFNDQELKVKDCKISSGSNTGDGYLGQILRVKIDTSKKKISVIAKVLMTNSTTTHLDETLKVFDVEKIVLQTVLPKLLTKLPNPVKFYAELYHADDEKRAFILEDLCEDGYQLCEHNWLGLDLQHSLLVMEVLAKLHATSYLFFKENPDFTKNFEINFYAEEKTRDVIEKMITVTPAKALMEIMDEWKLPEEYKKKFRNWEDWTEKNFQLWKRDDSCMNVLLHNDCWINNVMFKYNKNGVEAAKLIDFQIATYNCFAFDLILFIFSSTSTHVRLNCIDELLDRYYSAFTEITGDLPSFSKDRMRKEFNDRLFGGFLTAISITPVVMVPPKKAAGDLDEWLNNENPSGSTEMFKDPKYLECIEKLMPYFVRHNAI